MINEDIIYSKLEIATDLICRLYFHNIITDAIIFGSVARGTATKDSDIDIYLVNPQFQDEDNLTLSAVPETIIDSLFLTDDLKKNFLEKWGPIVELIKILRDIGIEFKEITRRDLGIFSNSHPYQDSCPDSYSASYSFYKGELFHLLTRDRVNPFMLDESIIITRDICKNTPRT